MATSSYTHRVDSELRAQSEAIFAALGMSLGTAINVFLKKAVAGGGFPCDVRIDTPTKEKLEAMLESEKIAKDVGVVALDVDSALEELKR